jgi:DNA-binding XRE family transcriptional regulator
VQPQFDINHSGKRIRHMNKNSLKKVRESMLVSKAELARRAKVSPITITRVESGLPCRMETKRKILLALGLKLTEKDKIFGNH